MAEEAFAKVGHFKDVWSFTQHLAALGLDLPCDQKVLSVLEGSHALQ